MLMIPIESSVGSSWPKHWKSGMMLEITFCKIEVCRTARHLPWSTLVAIYPGWWEMDQRSDLWGGWDITWVAKPRGWPVKQSPTGNRLQVVSLQDWFLGQYYLVSFNSLDDGLKFDFSRCVTKLFGMLAGSHHSVGPGEWFDRRSLVGFSEVWNPAPGME